MVCHAGARWGGGSQAASTSEGRKAKASAREDTLVG